VQSAPVPPKPPLSGAKSLREALASVTKKTEPAPVHAPDLKETLRTVAPEAPKKQEPREAPVHDGHTKEHTKDAGLSTEEMHKLLAVDGFDEKS
jgi:hypothetical protein